MIDVQKVREQTPGCEERIHLNNAGSSLPPTPVVDTVVSYLREEARVGGYELAALRKEDMERTYETLAKLIGADQQTISRAENATRAWDMAFYSVDVQRGDTILTTYTEYCANYVAYLQMRKRRGIRIEVIDDDDYGQLDLGDLERRLKRGAKMVTINHIPTNSGLVNPAEEVGKLSEKYGAMYLLDACQSVGQQPIDVERLRCDFLSTTGRKFLRAPRGTGFLYVRPEVLEDLEPPFLDAWAASYTEDDYTPHLDRRRFETFEFSHANFLGLGAAAEYAMDIGLNNIWSRVQDLSRNLRDRLSEIHGIEVRDLGETKCGIVTFEVNGEGHTQLRDKLLAHGVNVSVTSQFNALLDMKRRGFVSLMRASIHYYNTTEEIDRFIDILRMLQQSE